MTEVPQVPQVPEARQPGSRRAGRLQVREVRRARVRRERRKRSFDESALRASLKRGLALLLEVRRGDDLARPVFVLRAGGTPAARAGLRRQRGAGSRRRRRTQRRAGSRPLRRDATADAGSRRGVHLGGGALAPGENAGFAPRRRYRSGAHALALGHSGDRRPRARRRRRGARRNHRAGAGRDPDGDVTGVRPLRDRLRRRPRGDTARALTLEPFKLRAERARAVAQLLTQQPDLARLVVAVERGELVEGAARLALAAERAQVGHGARAGVRRARQRQAVVARGDLS